MRPEWENLHWEKFEERGGEYFAARKQKWLEIADDFLNAKVNTQIAMPTGTGKTIVACLIALGIPGKTLMLVPVRHLAKQHRETWIELTGQDNDSLDITGSLPKAKRNWTLENKRILFATGHVFERDVGLTVFLNDFKLLVIDESHHAQENYPYTLIAKMAAGLKLTILDLSATPGETESRIAKISANCFAERTLAVQMPSPKINEDEIKIPTDLSLNRVDTIFREMLFDSAHRLREIGYPAEEKKLMRWRGLNKLMQYIEKTRRDPFFYQALSEHALYCKILHLYQIAITESWQTFLDKAEELRFDGTRAADRLLRDTKLKEILEIAKKAPLHPKVAMLCKTAETLAKMRKKMIIFVAEVKTGRYLVKLLNSKGIPAALTLGSAHQSEAEREKILKSLSVGEFSAVVSTSVLDEGLSANVDEILHYSLPRGPISRQQRRGRTGREKTGHVIFFILQHPFDIGQYYLVWRRYWKMLNTIYGEEPPWERRKKKQLSLAL